MSETGSHSGSQVGPRIARRGLLLVGASASFAWPYGSSLPFFFLLLPFMIWAAFRFSQTEVTTATGLSSEAFAQGLLEEERVAVIPGSAFGPSGEGYVRACYATSYEQLEDAIAGIGRFVGRHRAGASA